VAVELPSEVSAGLSKKARERSQRSSLSLGSAP